MDDDLLKSMFLRARDQYESAVRWAFLVVLMLLLFHMMTFSQFVRLGNQLLHTRAEMGRLSTLQSIVVGLQSYLNDLENSPKESLKERLDGMVSDLRSDFAALDRAVAQIPTPVTSLFTTATPESLLGEEPPMLQMPLVGIQRTTKTFELDKDLESQIKAAKTPEELFRKVLRPVIEEKIVHPRFSQLNSYWQQEVLPKLRQQVDTILKEVQKGKPLSLTGEGLWDEIQRGVEQIMHEATTLEFQPPQDPDWWTSVAGKQATLSSIGQAVGDKLQAVPSSEAIVKLSNQVKAALDQQKKSQDTLQEKLKRIKEDFNRQQSKLATLGRPFEMLSLDLDVVVSRFPLLLGVVLAVTSIWPAYRLRELIWTVDLMAKRSEEKSPWEWVLGRIGFSFPRSQGTESGETFWRRMWQENWPWMLGNLSRYLFYWGWIGIAAWELAGWDDIDFNRAVMFTAGGCLAVAAALGYQWSTIRYIPTL